MNNMINEGYVATKKWNPRARKKNTQKNKNKHFTTVFFNGRKSWELRHHFTRLAKENEWKRLVEAVNRYERQEGQRKTRFLRKSLGKIAHAVFSCAGPNELKHKLGHEIISKQETIALLRISKPISKMFRLICFKKDKFSRHRSSIHSTLHVDRV